MLAFGVELEELFDLFLQICFVVIYQILNFGKTLNVWLKTYFTILLFSLRLYVCMHVSICYGGFVLNYSTTFS